jgi:hypothetical protein
MIDDAETAHNSEMTKKPKVHLKPALPQFTKKTSFKKTKDLNNNYEESDEEDDDEYDFDIDESFMVEEEDDDEDYVPESECKRNHSKKRSSKEMDPEKNKDKEKGRKRSKGSDASGNSSSDEMRSGPEEPYSQYTVPVLKAYLAERLLPVSGE